MRHLFSTLLMIFALCVNNAFCDDTYEIEIQDASGSIEWVGIAKVTQKIPGIKVRLDVADKVLPHYRVTTDSAFNALRANTAAVSKAYTQTHFHQRTTTETKTTAPTIFVNPTPVTVNPTPVVVNPTTIVLRPHYDWYRSPHTGRLIYGLVP